MFNLSGRFVVKSTPDSLLLMFPNIKVGHVIEVEMVASKNKAVREFVDTNYILRTPSSEDKFLTNIYTMMYTFNYYEDFCLEQLV